MDTMRSASAITNVNSNIVQLEAHWFIWLSLLHMAILYINEIFDNNEQHMPSTLIGEWKQNRMRNESWSGRALTFPLTRQMNIRIRTLIFGNSEDCYSLGTDIIFELGRHLRCSWNKSIVWPENLWVVHRDSRGLCVTKNRIGIAEERRSESTHGMPKIFSFTWNATNH